MARQQCLRAHKMGPVVHLTVNSDSARAGVLGKSRDDGFGFFNFRRRGREYLVDHRHLGRMNGKAPNKSI